MAAILVTWQLTNNPLNHDMAWVEIIRLYDRITDFSEKNVPN
jgi:hypothetical protein